MENPISDMPASNIIAITADEAFTSGLQSPLRTVCDAAIPGSAMAIEVIENLRATLHNDPITVGLAAPQIGVTLRICVVNITKGKQGEDLVLLNPEIIPINQTKVDGYESCMSIPHWKGKVDRFSDIVVKYTKPNGDQAEEAASGFKARVFQHEIDHLNGILFTDHLNSRTDLEETDLFKHRPPAQ